jgi:hypothetical protein
MRPAALEGLPCHQLPDVRSVVFIPHVDQFGSVLPGEWRLIRQAANTWHEILVAHAYEVSLEILQYWKRHGARIMQTVHERDRRIREGTAIDHPVPPLSPLEGWLPNWISVHASDLSYRDQADPYYIEKNPPVDEKQTFDLRMEALVPNVEARAAVSRATGYGVATVKKAVEEARRSVAGSRVRR